MPVVGIVVVDRRPFQLGAQVLLCLLRQLADIAGQAAGLAVDQVAIFERDDEAEVVRSCSQSCTRCLASTSCSRAS